MDIPTGETTPFGLKYRLERELRLFNEAEISQVPRGRTGVYALWLPASYADGWECIYVGKSEGRLRTRLREHLKRETNPELAHQLSLFRDIVRFSFAFTRGHQETLDLETAVIQAWQPLTNRNKRG